MMLVLSGEGPTDLGSCDVAVDVCPEESFRRGPMSVLIDQLAETRLKYSLASSPGSYVYVGKKALGQRHRASSGRNVAFRGKKSPDHETRYFFINAWMLGEFANDLEADRKDQAIAILFRDCDGTHSSESGMWQRKRQSMQDGFRRAGVNRGVAMLPKPKSEAWLLCAALPALACAAHEELPGNDDSPNSAKSRLTAALGGHHSADQLCEWLDRGSFDPTRAAAGMPSFAAFQGDFMQAIEHVLS